MAELGWDVRCNRPAVSPTPGLAGESTFAPPPQIDAVLAQLNRWEQALQAEVQAETDDLATTCNVSPTGGVPAASTQAQEAVPTKEDEKDEPGGNRDSSDIDIVAAMMAAAMR